MRSLIALSNWRRIPQSDKRKRERNDAERASMSFSLFSSLTLNSEYPAGVSNKSSMFLLLLLAAAVLAFFVDALLRARVLEAGSGVPIFFSTVHKP